ncbi:monocarboxylate transporter 7-like [Anoplophora glabripennis]|uniref:monocarboxylate transporter 7-like n=1 Tax=Anoplophora glabripennis TaxID=217634 RepID=UPI000873E4F2|nr:monocarboxylate transporter 7-like [Anoplophora glabripennis]
MNYKLVPPDGGWGYLIAASVAIMNLVTVTPQTAFGLTFGNFLASIGDETTGTTISNGIFNTVQSFTGLASSILLQRYSYRKVGLLGATLFGVGAFGIIFISNLTQMVICYGVLQGLGFGLMMPASYSAFNCYFDKRINVIMGIAQAVTVLGAITFSPVMALCIEYCGFRGTVTILAILSLLNFLAMGVLQPVKWHMKKISVKDSDILQDAKTTINDEVTATQIKPLLRDDPEDNCLTNNTNLSKDSLTNVNVPSKPRFSVISLGDRAASVTVINDLDDGDDNQNITCVDLSLLKNVKYLNVSLGVSLSYTSDVMFFALIPLILNRAGFSTPDIALLMMVYFGSDLVSRILISVISAFCKIRNRYVFLAGSFFSAIFRIAFVLSGNQMYKMITLAALGFLRCFIQTPLALVFSEEYNEQFPTAFSLYMVVSGFVNIAVGSIISVVKSFTQSDEMVVHVLTGAFLITSISWIVELTWNKIKTKDT